MSIRNFPAAIVGLLMSHRAGPVSDFAERPSAPGIKPDPYKKSTKGRP